MTTVQLEYVAFMFFMGMLVVLLTAGLDRALRRLDSGPDVGVDIVDCGMVHDCDGCEECGTSVEYLEAMWRAS